MYNYVNTELLFVKTVRLVLAGGIRLDPKTLLLLFYHKYFIIRIIRENFFPNGGMQFS